MELFVILYMTVRFWFLIRPLLIIDILVKENILID